MQALTNEELVRLYQDKQEKKVLDLIISKNINLIYHIINRHFYIASNSIEEDDLVQEGIIGLIKAVKRYKASKGAKLSTYAYMWIRQGIGRFLEQRDTSKEVSLNEELDSLEGNLTLGDTIQDDNDYIGDSMLKIELDNVMDQHLNSQQKKIIKLYYGWNNSPALNHDELATALEVAPSRAKYIQREALNALRCTEWCIRELEIREVERTAYKKEALQGVDRHYARLMRA